MVETRDTVARRSPKGSERFRPPDPCQEEVGTGIVAILHGRRAHLGQGQSPLRQIRLCDWRPPIIDEVTRPEAHHAIQLVLATVDVAQYQRRKRGLERAAHDEPFVSAPLEFRA
jgi:hypothetical protein